MLRYLIINPFLWFGRVLGSAALRFYWDDGFSRAASLAYTTLFALVPITALTLLMFSAFGIEEDQVGPTVDRIINQFLPAIEDELIASVPRLNGELRLGSDLTAEANLSAASHNGQLSQLRQEVADYLVTLAKNARTLGIVTLGFLCLIGVMLLNTVESALNSVWRVTSSLTLSAKILSFWGVITLGPLLIALSIFWTTRARALATEESQGFADLLSILNFVVPVIVTALALAMLFYKLPATRVRFRDAVVGAVVAAVMFEFVKRGFAYYLTLSSAYSRLYGVLATIPLFLFWLYVAWVVVLFGAHISYQAGSLNILSGLRKFATDLGEVGGILGLRILTLIGEKFLGNQPLPSESELATETGCDPVLVRNCLDVLTDMGILTSPDLITHQRGLRRSPSKITVAEVFDTFRSKKHRLKEVGDAGKLKEEQFLENLRNTAFRLTPERSVSSWTLEEMISANN